MVGRQKKGKVKTKLKLKSSKSEEFYPADLCMPKVKAPDSEEEVVTDRNNSKSKDDPEDSGNNVIQIVRKRLNRLSKLN